MSLMRRLVQVRTAGDDYFGETREGRDNRLGVLRDAGAVAAITAFWGIIAAAYFYL